MKMTLFLFLSFWASFEDQPINNELASQYIEKYRYLAISEMERSKIPASIKMAQALLESNMGRSTLAVKANNHFGIKCGNSWEGGNYYREDDDYKNGKLIKSCFRKYKNSSQSFIAHTEFLMKQPRYRHLFELSSRDYQSWAYGLKEAGYATDKAYPQKLIKLIETYDLHLLDTESVDEVVVVSKPKKSVEEAVKKVEKSSKREGRVKGAASLYTISEVNRIKVVVTSGHESLRQIARDQKVSLADLKKYNQDFAYTTGENIAAGEKIFLEKKRKTYSGKTKFHMVLENEKMEDIAAEYGINLEMLYIKNRMPLGAQPYTGEKIYLKGIGRLKDVPKYVEKGKRKSNKRVLF